MKQTKILRMETGRLGVILSNYSILGMLVIISSVLAMVMYGLSAIFWLILLIGTFGAILAIYPNYMQFFSKDNVYARFVEFVTPALPYIYWITLGTAIASIILMSFSYGKKPTAHIVLSSIIAGLCILFITGAIGG